MTTEELSIALSDAYQAVRRAQKLSANPESLQIAERMIIQTVTDRGIQNEFTTCNLRHTELSEEINLIHLTNGK